MECRPHWGFFFAQKHLLSYFTNKKLFQWHLVCHAVLSITLVFRHCLRSVEVLNCCSDHKKIPKTICILDKNRKSNAKPHKICKPKWRKLKNQSFLTQKLKDQSKISQNCKTKNPNALLLIEEWYIPLASFCPWKHDTILLNTAVKVTTWSLGEKTLKWTCTLLSHPESILAYYATSQIFIKNILTFSYPLF